MSRRRPVFRLTVVALIAGLALAGAGCRSDERMRALLAERAMLQREIAGFRALDTILARGLVTDSTEIVLSVGDTVVRELLTASLPIAARLRHDVGVRLTRVRLALRGNVARVELEGTATRDAFPRAAASLRVAGALEQFRVDSAQALHARIRLDEATVSSPTGMPDALGGTATALLQIVIDRALPDLAAALPELTLPVHLDRALRLPGFGPEGALTVQPAEAAIQVSASRVLAFDDRLTVVLRVARGPFLSLQP